MHRLEGGEGSDTVSYIEATGGVTVTVGAGADDGTLGESDDVDKDVERVVGSTFDDHLVGGQMPVRFEGGEGADVLSGGPAADALYGGPGGDSLDGAAGELPRGFLFTGSNGPHCPSGLFLGRATPVGRDLLEVTIPVQSWPRAADVVVGGGAR